MRATTLSLLALVLGACARPPATPRPFFAFDNAAKDAAHPDPASQIALLKQLGYDGIGSVRPREVAPALEAAARHGIKIFSIYAVVSIDEGAMVDPVLFEAFRHLNGRGIPLWLGLTSKQFKPSDPAGDSLALTRLAEIADAARKNDVPIILYPHAGFWIERTDDAVRFAEKSGRPDLGVMFNLCHFLKVDPAAKLDAVLDRARPRLRCVSINGADAGATDWKQLIQTLDRGTYDVRNVLRALDRIGYAGPVGFQGYAIPGEAPDKLRRTLDAWRRLQSPPTP